jgi:hypothetical protein
MPVCEPPSKRAQDVRDGQVTSNFSQN